MASNAVSLANFGSGIGTQGAVLQVDNTNNRLGVGTTNPQSTMQVGTGITMDGFLGQIRTTGVITASSFVGDGAGLTGVASTDFIITGTAATFTGGVSVNELTSTGNVTIGGTLTYEDVANIDSVGVVTARSGIDLTGGRYTNVATAVGALDVNMSLGNYFTKTITTGINTFTFSNPPTSGTVGSFTLELTHTGGTADWPTEVKWPGDTAPNLSSGKTHLFMFITDDGGTRYRGAALANYVN